VLQNHKIILNLISNTKTFALKRNKTNLALILLHYFNINHVFIYIIFNVFFIFP